jgi:guanylate kinase
MKLTGTPYIISAPSGAGKTSLVNALVQADPNILVSVSHTTRPIRPGEKNDVNYHFVSQIEFEALLAKHAFLEYAKVFDHYYGTSREWLATKLQQGNDVILEIDWQGAQQIRKQLPEAISIFILPPSLDVLRQRLIERGQDNEQVIAKRMQQAQLEIAHYQEFDYIVVNENFQQALKDLQTIFAAQKLRQSFQINHLANLIKTLL